MKGKEVQDIGDFAKIKETSRILKAIAHPVRLCIVKKLFSNKKVNVKAIWECLGVPQAVVSQHLAILRKAGIVGCEKEKRCVFYYINDGAIKKLVSNVITFMGL